MTLLELNGQFVKLSVYHDDPETFPEGRHSFKVVDTIAEAQGIMFLCPACWVKNSGSIGTHSIICWSRSRGVPDERSPGPGRWTFHGSGIGDLTVLGDPVGSAASVNAGCWHGFITGGKIC
jgi:hypothetical protein